MFKKLLLLFLVLPALSFAGDDENAAEIAYYALTPPLITNVQGKPKYVKAEIQLMTERADKLDDIILHAPAIRHELLMLIASKDGDDLRTPDGKEKLREEALETVRSVLKRYAGKKLVEELYFTAFFVQ